MHKQEILVTGGTGYIGSHAVVELIEAGFRPIIVDNLVNSSRETLDRIEKITGTKPEFHEIDVADKEALRQVFAEHNFDAVMHFAGLKAVGESVAKPLEYYRNNLDSSLSLFELMLEFGVSKLIFSSSATVYGTTPSPCAEDDPTDVGITNPYGQTKFMIEQIMRDICVANPDFSAIALRYFNPVGAHESGLIGEEPNGIPNNLLPFVLKVATGELPEVKIFGDDYDTADGTGVRDFIHVVDLVKGHLSALNYTGKGFQAFNLGTGRGNSVREIIQAVEVASGKNLPVSVEARRPGDLAVTYADVSKAERELGWRAEKSLQQACTDSWNWVNK